MANPVVLLVHGMGTHKEGDITRDFVAGVNEAAANFGLQNYDISKKIQVEEYNYSEFIDHIREMLSQASEDVRSFSLLSANGIESSVVNKLLEFENNLTKDEMLYTHWLDVILYGATHFGEPIRVGLARKLNQLFKDTHPRDVHIICHSLGTAVVHDTLVKIYRSDADIKDEVPDFKPGEFNLKTLWTFANVSRLVYILNDIANPKDSIVHSGTGGCADRFYNIRHEFDPFTWFKTYDRQMTHGKTIETKIIRILNTHDFKEYVTDPHVAKSLIAKLDFDQDLITDEQLDTAIEKHKKNSFTADYNVLRDAIKGLKATDSDSFIKVFEAANKLKSKIKELDNNF